MQLYYSQKQFIQIKEPGTLNTEDEIYKVLGECLGKQTDVGHISPCTVDNWYNDCANNDMNISFNYKKK